MTNPIPYQLELSEDRFINGDWYSAEGSPSRGTVVVIHGYKGFKDYGMFPAIGAGISQDGWDVLLFNFSHNGVGLGDSDITETEKFARNTYSLEQEDLLAVVDHIRGGTLPTGFEQKPKPWPLYLLGHSKGGGAALLFALDHPDLIQGVISWNGIVDFDLYSASEKSDMLTQGRGYTPNARTGVPLPLDKVILDDLESNRERYNLLERVRELRVPAVLIQGEKDHDRLLKGSGRLKEAQPAIKWHLIPEGDHRFNTVHPYQGTTPAFEEALRLTKLWLRDETGEV